MHVFCTLGKSEYIRVPLPAAKITTLNALFVINSSLLDKKLGVFYRRMEGMISCLSFQENSIIVKTFQPIEVHMHNRDEIILQLLNHQGKVSVQEVAQQCEMSVETIRRDLNRLEKKGLLYRTHGGAVSGKINDLGSFFQIRQHVNAAAKRHIAKNALELLYENAVIGLDASSTSWYFAYLMPDIPCTVVTNSIFNVNALVNKPNIKTIVTGGVYSHKYEAFYGPLSEYLLQRLHINFSIFSCSGIDNEGNIWESNELNASLKRKMMEASEKCYLLVDQSKFEKKSLIQLSGLNKIDTIFTDSALPFPLQKYCDKVDTMTVI